MSQEIVVTRATSGLFIAEAAREEAAFKQPRKRRNERTLHKLVYTDRGEERTIYIECSDKLPRVAFAFDGVSAEGVSDAVVGSSIPFVDMSSLVASGEAVEVWHWC